MVSRRDVVILGSTGSIGTQALDLVRANPDRFRVVALTAGGSQPDLFEQQVAEFAPAFSGSARRPRSRPRAGLPTSCSTASPARSGCGPTLAALDAGNTLALANKESLIMGGPLVLERAKPGQIVPGRLRALRARPVPARRPRRRGTPARADRAAAARSAAAPAQSSPT